MIKKVLQDCVALEEMFGDLSPEKERSIKVAVKRMLETEEYAYVKYHILKMAIRRMEIAASGATSRSADFIQSAGVGDDLANSLNVKEQEKRVSHYRGKIPKS